MTLHDNDTVGVWETCPAFLREQASHTGRDVISGPEACVWRSRRQRFCRFSYSFIYTGSLTFGGRSFVKRIGFICGYLAYNESGSVDICQSRS